MFIIETDRFRLIFPFKGGSRSFCDELFGSPSHKPLQDSKGYVPFDTIYEKKSLNSYLLQRTTDGIQNIVVLREPKDRFKSAWRMAEQLARTHNRDFDEELKRHGEPYIRKFDHKISFKYILFEEIHLYLTVKHGEFEKGKQPVRRWLKKFDAYYDFDAEQEAYDYHVKFKRKITPEEFNILVQLSSYINVKISYDGKFGKFKKLRYGHLRYRPLQR